MYSRDELVVTFVRKPGTNFRVSLPLVPCAVLDSDLDFHPNRSNAPIQGVGHQNDLQLAI